MADASTNSELILPRYLSEPINSLLGPERKSSLTEVSTALGECVGRRRFPDPGRPQGYLVLSRGRTTVELRGVWVDIYGYGDSSAVPITIRTEGIEITGQRDGRPIRVPLKEDQDNFFQRNLVQDLAELTDGDFTDDDIFRPFDPAIDDMDFRTMEWSRLKHNAHYFGPIAGRIIAAPRLPMLHIE